MRAMDGAQENPRAIDDTPTLEGDEATFSIEDIELETSESTSLGDTQDAREDHGVGDLEIGKSSLDGVFSEILYGLYKDRPACRVMLLYTIKSHSFFRINGAELVCTVGTESTGKFPVSSSDVVRPRILKTIPRDLSDDNPTTVGVTATRTFSPNVTIPDGSEFSIGSFTKQKTYEETYGWHLHSTTTSSDGQNATTRDTGTWTLTANRLQKDSKLHQFGIEILIRHAGQPFYADFALKATLAFGAAVRTIGRRKEIRTRRRFHPFESAIAFS